ncbi:putative RNA-directed DNA polymerase from transposon X-element [Trichonephila clavipes]|uniref:Putative RNA-directed DNA polymerase from transposon X-element n=1 Tax=Trichonephila clavipes TaxID=2585209 RepID=A0A8X6WIF9_TRICX|nr:putative RNA-directed DNA polymerase from transposon X-element [Trichonephila clavipes]
MSDPMQQPVCYQDLKASIQHYVHHIWQETWDEQILNKLHSIHPSTSHWAALPVRRHDIRLIRIHIGHARFTHRHLLLGENAPECPSCNVPYSIYHILIECPVFNHHRITFFHTSVLTLSDLLFDQVSEFDRGRVVAYRDCGLTFRKIGSRVGRNQTTVMRVCDRWMPEGTTDHRGRSHSPQCTTSCVDRKILCIAVTDRSVAS